MMSDYDRLLEASMRAFESAVVDQVEREFAALPDGVCETPWIDKEFFPIGRVALKQLVIRARCCQHWFGFEAPRWAPPLPLKLDDCHALFNGVHRGNQRSMLVGRYGIVLRGMAWDYKRALPFEVFCAQVLAPPAKRGCGIFGPKMFRPGRVHRSGLAVHVS